MYVYILECADRSYYTGVTNDIERRLCEHNNAEDSQSYTSSRLPVTLKYCGIFYDPTNAIAFEKQIKGWSRKKKEALFGTAENWELIQKLAKKDFGK